MECINVQWFAVRACCAGSARIVCEAHKWECKECCDQKKGNGRRLYSWGIAVHGRELTLFVLLKDKLSVAKVRMPKEILLNVKLVKQNKIAVVNWIVSEEGFFWTYKKILVFVLPHIVIIVALCNACRTLWWNCRTL